MLGVGTCVVVVDVGMVPVVFGVALYMPVPFGSYEKKTCVYAVVAGFSPVTAVVVSR